MLTMCFTETYVDMFFILEIFFFLDFLFLYLLDSTEQKRQEKKWEGESDTQQKPPIISDHRLFIYWKDAFQSPVHWTLHPSLKLLSHDTLTICSRHSRTMGLIVQ